MFGNHTPVSDNRKSLAPGSSLKHLSGRMAKMKDPRMVFDKSFMLSAVKQISVFLTSTGYPHSLSPKFIQGPSGKEFYGLMQFLFSQIDPNTPLTKKMDEELPEALQRIRYPMNVTKASLLLVGAPTTWPLVLGCLHWVVELLSIDMKLIQPYLRGEEPLLKKNTPADGKKAPSWIDLEWRRRFDILARTYKAFLHGQDEIVQELHGEKRAQAESTRKARENTLLELAQERNSLEARLAEAEKRPRLAEMKDRVARLRTDVVKKKSNLSSEKRKLQELQEQLTHLKTKADASDREQRKLETEKERLDKVLREQPITVAEQKSLLQERVSLTDQLKHLSKKELELTEMEKSSEEKRINVYRIRDDVRNKCKAHMAEGQKFEAALAQKTQELNDARELLEEFGKQREGFLEKIAVLKEKQQHVDGMIAAKLRPQVKEKERIYKALKEETEKEAKEGAAEVARKRNFLADLENKTAELRAQRENIQELIQQRKREFRTLQSDFALEQQRNEQEILRSCRALRERKTRDLQKLQHLESTLFQERQKIEAVQEKSYALRYIQPGRKSREARKSLDKVAEVRGIFFRDREDREGLVDKLLCSGKSSRSSSFFRCPRDEVKEQSQVQSQVLETSRVAHANDGATAVVYPPAAHQNRGPPGPNLLSGSMQFGGSSSSSSTLEEPQQRPPPPSASKKDQSLEFVDCSVHPSSDPLMFQDAAEVADALAGAGHSRIKQQLAAPAGGTEQQEEQQQQHHSQVEEKENVLDISDRLLNPPEHESPILKHESDRENGMRSVQQMLTEMQERLGRAAASSAANTATASNTFRPGAAVPGAGTANHAAAASFGVAPMSRIVPGGQGPQGPQIGKKATASPNKHLAHPHQAPISSNRVPPSAHSFPSAGLFEAEESGIMNNSHDQNLGAGPGLSVPPTPADALLQVNFAKSSAPTPTKTQVELLTAEEVQSRIVVPGELVELVRKPLTPPPHEGAGVGGSHQGGGKENLAPQYVPGRGPGSQQAVLRTPPPAHASEHPPNVSLDQKHMNNTSISFVSANKMFVNATSASRLADQSFNSAQNCSHDASSVEFREFYQTSRVFASSTGKAQVVQSYTTPIGGKTPVVPGAYGRGDEMRDQHLSGGEELRGFGSTKQHFTFSSMHADATTAGGATRSSCQEQGEGNQQGGPRQGDTSTPRGGQVERDQESNRSGRTPREQLNVNNLRNFLAKSTLVGTVPGGEGGSSHGENSSNCSMQRQRIFDLKGRRLSDEKKKNRRITPT